MDSFLPFGCIIPGRPLIANFVPIDTTKCMSEVANPQTVTDISFFLFPQAASIMTPLVGAILYFATGPGFNNWEILGSITLEKPSATFRTGWAAREDILSAPVIRLGVSIEPLEVITNLHIESSGVEDRFAYAHKIAIDLFQFMSSFAQEPKRSDLMVVPTNILDRWFERFERKYKLDPNFMMKNNI